MQGDRLPCPMEASEVPAVTNETRDGDLSTDLALNKKIPSEDKQQQTELVGPDTQESGFQGG